MDKVIRVLVVDDSAYIRKVIKKILSRSPFIEVVGAACDGEEALQLVDQLNPDVITLDIVMPRLDGVGFLRQQMVKKPMRVIIVSITSESSERVLEALDLGAIDFVRKPTSLATDKILEITEELIAKVKAAANVNISHLNVPPKSPLQCKPVIRPITATSSKTRRADIVVLGISTGGPQALRYLIPQLPGNFPVPIAMVLHMPVGYTRLYAEKLNEISELTVMEAQEGLELQAGVALLASRTTFKIRAKPGHGGCDYPSGFQSFQHAAPPGGGCSVSIGCRCLSESSARDSDDGHGVRWKTRGRLD
jgi:two-component system, chemotaxis family, protein-glutamate methylesterase/glutaminase